MTSVRIGGEAEPAVGRQRLQPDVVLVLAEGAAEFDRADAERMVEHHVEADRVALEAAEMAGIVALLELRAVLEEVRHGGDGERRGDQDDDAARRRPRRAR